MRASFVERGPKEKQEAPRGLLGFLAKSQSAQRSGHVSPPHGSSSESDDDEDQERFRYPGMPREPRPIKLTDPYPGGKLAGSKAAVEVAPDVQPLEHDGSTTVLYVKAGSEHRALLYLMQKVNRYFALDDMLPEVPPEIAAYHYLVLAPPKDGPVDGDATTSFRNSTLFLLSGLVVRRVKMLAKDPMSVGLLDSTVLQRRLPMRKLAARLADTPGGGAAAATGGIGNSSIGSGSGRSSSFSTAHATRKASFARRLGGEASGESDPEPGRRREAKRWAPRSRRNGPPELIPVAIYSHPLYLDTAASIIRNFNRTGLIVTPYLYSTVVAAAAVCTIQGWWRSHLIRGMSNFGALLKMSRAARTIQRAWRNYILRSRLLMLSTIRRLAASVGSLLLGANLALTAGHCTALRERAGRPRPAALFPEQRLRFGFDRAGALLLVEPDKVEPKSVREGTWTPGLPPHPVPRSLPEWCAVPLAMSGERAAVSVHGCREVAGLESVLQLITCDTVWRDNAGNELSRTTLPDTSPPDPAATAATFAGGGTPADVVLAVITFPSVHEAAVRAALLSMYTWDPLRRTGVNLVPLHQTAAARGVQTQAAVVQAINTIAASAGHLVTTPPEAEPPPATAGPAAAAAAAAGTSPIYPSTVGLAWRHAPPGSRERQRGSGIIGGGATPTRDLRSPLRSLISPFPSGQASPMHHSGASSFSHGLSGSHTSLGRSQSHSHVQSQSSSPARSVSPQRQRIGGGSGGLPVAGSPASPKKGQRSPQPAVAAAAPSDGGGGGSGNAASRTPSPLRRKLGQLPLPPVQGRPGTVPMASTSKFHDLDPRAPGAATAAATAPLAAAAAAAAVTVVVTGDGSPAEVSALAAAAAAAGGGGGGGVHHRRPRTTPSSWREGESSPVASLCGGEPSLAGMAHGTAAAAAARSPGGLYGTQPGAPQPLDNVPLSNLARALSPPPTHRASSPRASYTNSPVVGGGRGTASGTGSRRETDSTDFLLNRDGGPQGGGRMGSPPRGSTPSLAAGPYRGYDMPRAAGTDGAAVGAVSPVVPAEGDGNVYGRGSSAGSATHGGAGDGAAEFDVEAPRASRSPPVEWAGGQEAAAAAARQLEGEDAARTTALDSISSPVPSPPSLTARRPPPYTQTQRQQHPPQEQQLQQPSTAEQLVESPPAISGEPGFEPEQEQQPEQGDPYSRMTVLQRHQALGLYNDMVLLPVQRRRPGAEVESPVEAAGFGAEFEGLYYSDHLAPPSLGRQPSGSFLPYSDSDRDAGGAGAGVDNPELVVAPMYVEYVHAPSLVVEVTEALASQARSDRHFADNTVRIGKLITAEEAFARHRQLMSTLMLTQVIGRQTAVGHVHAPNYTPLSVRAMNQIVSEMRRVYRGEAAELVANMREQHKEAIAAVKEELVAAARQVATTSCVQAAVVDSELARAEEERERSMKARATRAHVRALRRERAAQDRAFAAAFGRQVAGAGKQVVRSEIRARDAVMAEAAAVQGAIRRQLNKMTAEHIAQAASEAAAANRVRASLVRAEGWTAQVASHYHLLDQWQADIVALRRDDNYARMRRVGPAGGVWGSSRPRELLRAPLPVTNVVSAAAAAAAATAAASGAVISAPATGAWRSLSAGDARHSTLTATAHTPPGSGGGSGGDAEGMPPAITGGTRVSFSSLWPFEGDHGSLAASSAPPSTLPSRQAPLRRSLLPVPQPLPEGYIPGGGGGGAAVAAAATAAAMPPLPPPPLIEDSEAVSSVSTASQVDNEVMEGAGVVAAAMRPGSKAAMLAAIAAANGLRQRGSPPRNLVEGPEGRLVDFLPEAYSVQPFGSRQGPNPPRPIGIVVSRF